MDKETKKEQEKVTCQCEYCTHDKANLVVWDKEKQELVRYSGG